MTSCRTLQLGVWGFFQIARPGGIHLRYLNMAISDRTVSDFMRKRSWRIDMEEDWKGSDKQPTSKEKKRVQLLPVFRKSWKIRQTIHKNQHYKEPNKMPNGFVKNKPNENHSIFFFDRKQALWTEEGMSNVFTFVRLLVL